MTPLACLVDLLKECISLPVFTKWTSLLWFYICWSKIPVPPHLPLLATDQKWEYDGELSYGIAVLAQIARSIGG